MKSYKHKFIKICSSMKVSLLYILIIYALIVILFYLQMMCILYFTYSTVCRSSVSHCVNHSVFQYLSKYIRIYNIRYYKNVFAHNCYYYAYDSNAFVLGCVCLNKFHVARLINTLMKMAFNSRSNLCSH